MLGSRFVTRTRLKVTATVVVLLVTGIGGAWTLGVVGTPSVQGVENEFGGVNESTTVIDSDLVVDNPNPIGVQLGNFTASYAVEMNGIQMATGEKQGLDVAKQGNTSVPLRTEMNNSKLPAWWVSHVENDEQTTLTVDASVHSGIFGQSFSPQVSREVNTDIIDAFNSDEDRPIDANQPLVSDPVLWLNRTTGSWGDVNENRTEVEMAFDLHNPKAVPLTITEIGYDIRMNGVTMGEGATEQSVVIPASGTRTVEATTRIDNQNLDEWWVTHLQNDQVTTLELEFYAVVDLSGAGGDTVRIPLDTVEQTIETDMFGNKADSSSGGDGDAGSETDSTGGTETAGETESTGETESSGETDSEATDTDAPTETPTAEPSPTPTDDDGLVPDIDSGAVPVDVGN
jgi:LEA14-like dessication related protein